MQLGWNLLVFCIGIKRWSYWEEGKKTLLMKIMYVVTADIIYITAIYTSNLKYSSADLGMDFFFDEV